MLIVCIYCELLMWPLVCVVCVDVVADCSCDLNWNNNFFIVK